MDTKDIIILYMSQKIVDFFLVICAVLFML